MNTLVSKIESVVRPRPQLTNEALETLDAILDEYERLAQDAKERDAGDDFVINQIRKKAEEEPQTIWWSDFALAEQCATHMLPADQVPARLAAWRRRLQDVAGRDRYAGYLQTATSTTETDEKKLRADLAESMNSVYYLYSSYGIAGYSRSQVTGSLLLTAVEVILFELAVLVIAYWLPTWLVSASAFQFLQWFVATSIAGVLGSVVSVQRRLQDPSTSSVDGIYRYITTNADWFSTSVVSPILGAIFGMLMYGLLASGLLAGNLVHFKDLGATFIVPISASDGAFLVVFGFISGFAEQLIPDALTRIASRALGGSEAATTTSAPLTSTTEPIKPSTNGVATAGSTSTNGKVTVDSSTNSKPPTLDPTPELSPEAALRGQDPKLVSEPAVDREGS